MILGAIWVATLSCGFASLWSYSTAPGDNGNPAEVWPAETCVIRDESLPTLVMLAHPRCPCTRASVSELERLMAASGGKLAARVVFYKPVGESDRWARTDLWNHAAAIPGVDVQSDEGGAEIQRFGAVTSGHVLVYDSLGDLVFQGGITASRGHAGDNFGRSAILALLKEPSNVITDLPTYGCRILEEVREVRPQSGEDVR